MQIANTQFFKQIKFWVSTFVDKELTLFAASISFYTIFTIIPISLILLTLLTSMPSFEEHYESIKTLIFSNLMPVNSEAMMGYIDGFLENSTKMGMLGLAMIFVSSLLFFKNFEFIANKIFKAPQRTFFASLRTYLVMISFTPFALGLSFSITGYLATLMASNALTENLNVLALLPYLIIWGLFFLIFQMGANTKIDPRASVISSLIISVTFTLSKNAFIYYVFLSKSYSTMYGTFATVMFLFLWIYVSWIIFIYGLKLCHIIDGIYKNKSTIKR